jgi:hypothetical protein
VLNKGLVEEERNKVMEKSQGNGINGYFEPELRHTFLPGCRNCGGSHPLARKPMPVDTEHCPDCEAPVLAPGQTHVEKAVITGSPVNLFGRACLSLGKALTNLSKRI